MAFPFSRFIKKATRENPGKAESSSSPQDTEQSADPEDASPEVSEPAHPAGPQGPINPGIPGKIVKPIPIREPKSQKQQKKISARIHIPPISLRQPDDEPMMDFKRSPRTSLPPAPQKPGGARRTVGGSQPVPSEPQDEAASAQSSPSEADNAKKTSNIINAPFPGTGQAPQQAPPPEAPRQSAEEYPEATPEDEHPAASLMTSLPEDDAPAPQAQPQQPQQPAETPRTQKPPTHFHAGRPATPRFESQAQASQNSTPAPAATSSAARRPPRPRRPSISRLRLPTRPPQIPRPPKFGPRIDEPDTANGNGYRGEVQLKKSPPKPPSRGSGPGVLPPAGTPLVPRIPLETKRLFASKMPVPAMPPKKVTRRVSAYPSVPQRSVPPADEPAVADPENEIIDFEQAQKELGPLIRGEQSVRPPSDQSIVTRHETARIPVPAHRQTPRTAPPAAPAKPITEEQGFDYTTLREIFLTDEPLDLPAIARLVTDFPGITHCLILDTQGNCHAGELTPEVALDDFSEKVPGMVRQVNTYGSSLGLGDSKVFTVYCEDGIISFFTEDEICVSVKHHMRGFLPGVREKLERVTEEVAALHASFESAKSATGS